MAYDKKKRQNANKNFKIPLSRISCFVFMNHFPVNELTSKRFGQTVHNCSSSTSALPLDAALENHLAPSSLPPPYLILMSTSSNSISSLL